MIDDAICHIAFCLTCCLLLDSRVCPIAFFVGVFAFFLLMSLPLYLRVCVVFVVCVCVCVVACCFFVFSPSLCFSLLFIFVV